MEGGEKYKGESHWGDGGWRRKKRGRVSTGEMEGGEKRKKKLNYSSRPFPKTEIKL